MSQPNTSAPHELDDTTTLAEAVGVYDPDERAVGGYLVEQFEAGS